MNTSTFYVVTIKRIRICDDDKRVNVACRITPPLFNRVLDRPKSLFVSRVPHDSHEPHVLHLAIKHDHFVVSCMGFVAIAANTVCKSVFPILLNGPTLFLRTLVNGIGWIYGRYKFSIADL